MDRLLAASDAIDRVLERISAAVGWLFVVCATVICFDVLSRKFGYQIPGMGSTRLQELEWHLHAALFCFWLGTAYVKNAHVRIDIALANAKPRTHAMMEFVGCLIFAHPVLPDRDLLQHRFHLARLEPERVVRLGDGSAVPMDSQGLHHRRPPAAFRGRHIGPDAADRLPLGA